MEWDISWIRQDTYIKVVSENMNQILSCASRKGLNEFNSNIIDPIKMTFSYFASTQSKFDLIDFEQLRQEDKSVNNIIGKFHQQLLGSIDGCYIPKAGFDIVVKDKHIFAELKNKHNTMNSSSSQKTYINMQNKILEDDRAKCYLVEVIAKRSQDIIWSISLDGQKRSHEKIRRISIDKFYELITGDSLAFSKLISWLPFTLKKLSCKSTSLSSTKALITALEESGSFFKGIYHLAFNTYQGFEDFTFEGEEYLGEDFSKGGQA